MEGGVFGAGEVGEVGDEVGGQGDRVVGAGEGLLVGSGVVGGQVEGLEVGELGAPVVELFGVGVGVLPGGVVGVLQGEVGRSGGVPVVWAW